MQFLLSRRRIAVTVLSLALIGAVLYAFGSRVYGWYMLRPYLVDKPWLNIQPTSLDLTTSATAGVAFEYAGWSMQLPFAADQMLEQDGDLNIRAKDGRSILFVDDSAEPPQQVGGESAYASSLKALNLRADDVAFGLPADVLVARAMVLTMKDAMVSTCGKDGVYLFDRGSIKGFQFGAASSTKDCISLSIYEDERPALELTLYNVSPEARFTQGEINALISSLKQLESPR